MMVSKRMGKFRGICGAIILVNPILTVLLDASIVGAEGQDLSLMNESVVVATIEGLAITEKELIARGTPQLHKLRTQEYEIKQAVLEELIGEKLLDIEASRQGLTVETLLQKNVEARVGELSDAEVEAYYMGQKDRIGRPFSEVRGQLREALRNAKIQLAREAYVASLRQQSSITVSLDPPRINVDYDSKLVRGDNSAPVTIVEFSDYHCPYCKRVQPTLNSLLSRYSGKIKLAFRDLPLVQLHPQSRRAAEAARCANDQGKFWEYHDMLFEQAPKATDEDLKHYAERVGLDSEKFAKCLFQSVHLEAVQRDIDDASKMGMTGTPGFFINGRQLSGAVPVQVFEQIIEDELGRQAINGSSASH